MLVSLLVLHEEPPNVGEEAAAVTSWLTSLLSLFFGSVCGDVLQFCDGAEFLTELLDARCDAFDLGSAVMHECF